MKIIILYILLISIGSSKLLLSKHIQKTLPGNVGLTCSKDIFKQAQELDLSDIVSKFNNSATAPKATDFISYSGWQTVDHEENSCFGYIFYGAMEAKGDKSKLAEYPLLIWLQGGPGGSSQIGNFEEMGPIRVYQTDNTSDFTYMYNEFSWNQKANMLFLDNPLGTGLSIVSDVQYIPTNQDDVALHFVIVMENMYKDGGLFSKMNLNLSQTQEVFLSGESYAGKYVPSIADYIINNNKTSSVNLKAIMVGDGFTDPMAIQSELAIFGWNIGWLDYQEQQVQQSNIFQGNQLIDMQQWNASRDQFDVIMTYLSDRSGMNDPYNLVNQVEYQPFDIVTWMNDANTKKIFKIPESLNWSDITLEVYEHLALDFMKRDVVERLERLLQKGFPVLYYNGQNDVIVCTICTEKWLDKIQYSGNTNNEFASLQFTTYNVTINGKTTIGGYYKQQDNLSFATVNKAGHLVPMDQPEAALHLISYFMENRSLKGFK